MGFGAVNVNVQYLYRADGVKLRKSYTYGSGKINTEANITTDYLDGFHYEGSVLGKGDKPMVLKFLPTAEGYYDFENNAYIYHYKDHLGNIRLSYKNSGVGAEIVEEHHYYPFGLKHGTGGTYGTYKYQFQGQEQQEETGWYSFKWRNYDPGFGRFFGIDPLSEKFPYNSTYAIQENKMGLGVELEGMELLKNHTGYFAIRGNEMVVKQSPLTQRDSYGRPSFKAGDIGLSINGYHPDHSRITSGHTGLKLDIYKYTGPTVSGVQMQDTPDKISNKERQVFTTTKTGSEMWNLKQVALDRAIAKAEGVREIVGLVNLGINIPYAIKSTINYVQASNDIVKIESQAMRMADAINYVNQSGIKMNDQLRNDTINYIFDGTLPSPEKGLMPNSLIIQHGTKIMNANGIQVQSLNEQLKINNKIPK